MFRLAWRLLTAWLILNREPSHMTPSDVTIEILKGIRDEVRTLREDTNARLAETNGYLDRLDCRQIETNERLDRLERRQSETNEHLQRLEHRQAETNERLDRLEHRQTEGEVRLATEVVAVAGAVREVRDLLREDLAVKRRVDDHERRLVALEVLLSTPKPS